MVVFDQIRLLHLKKIPTLYSVDIEADTICQTKKKKIRWIPKIRSSRSQMLLNTVVLENFANFTGKYLCWSLFFDKVAGLQLY